MSEGSLPTTLDGVTRSIQATLIDIWSDFVSHTPYLGGAFLALLFTWGVSRLVRFLGNRLLAKSRMRQSLKDLILRLISIAVWLFGFLLSAMIVFPGLTPTKALGGLGLVSVAVGFAFKDIFENFFAGILLLWRYPFENGDYIECEDVEGKIERIEIRMTLIRKTNGELIVVPNSFLFKNPVRVLTDLSMRRVSVLTGIAYGEDIAQSVDVIKDAICSCNSIIQEQSVQVFPQSFGSSSIDIEMAWWTKPTPLDIRSSRGEVITAVKKALDDAGIEIPFPHRTLTFKHALDIVQSREPENQLN